MSSVKELVKLTLFILIPLSLSLTGCVWQTHTQDPTHAKTISYDEYGNQTGGLISIDKEKKLFIVTPLTIERYNNLILKYGKTRFSPELKKNFGVEPYGDLYFSMTPLAWSRFDMLVTIDNAQQKINQKKKKRFLW